MDQQALIINHPRSYSLILDKDQTSKKKEFWMSLFKLYNKDSIDIQYAEVIYERNQELPICQIIEKIQFQQYDLMSNRNRSEYKAKYYIENLEMKMRANSLPDQIFFHQKQQMQNRQIVGNDKDKQLNINSGIESNLQNEMELCMICFAEPVQINLACNHQFCIQCINNYISIKINNSDIKKIICPQDNCNKVIQEEFIINFLTQQAEQSLLIKYHKFKRRIEIEQTGTLKECINEKCQGIIKKQNELGVCQNCNVQICWKCNQYSHGKQSCSKQIDEKFQKYVIDNKVQICPKCASRIEKSSGCNHMTCIKCSYQFCWLCGGKYSSRHYREYNIFGCPGLQNTGSKPRCHNLKICIQQSCKLTVKLLAGLGVAILIILGFILFMIGNFTGLFQYLLRYSNLNKCIHIILILLIFLVQLVFVPYQILIGIYPGKKLITKISDDF